jgi:uncharacterized protein (DUF58 family)
MADVLSQRPTRTHDWTGFLHLHVPEAWKRFLLAILGLGLAFGAAIFSRVSRESGDLWATLVLASLALLLAAVVGLTTVPYLARRVAIPRVRDVFDYDVTRIGMVFCIAAILIGIAALNTGNNLLYIIVASMLAAMLVSGLASAITLRELELDVRLPEHVFAGKTVSARILLHNLRRWVPSFSVTVIPPKLRKERKQWHWEPGSFSFPPGRPPERQWLHLPDRSFRLVAQPAGLAPIFGEVYFPYIGRNEELFADINLNFVRRGHYQQNSFGLSTCFPFSFLQKTRHIPLKRELIVYPSVEPTDEILEALPLITGEFESFMRGRGYDLYRIREYMPEDSARHVDWKATAKSGSLKVREFTREDERKLRIVFDNPAPQGVSADTYERAVALAASLAWHFNSQDADVSFAAPDYDGTGDVYGFLAFLATINAKPGTSIIEQLRPSEEYNVIVTTRARGTIPTAVWSRSYILFVEDEQPKRDSQS